MKIIVVYKSGTGFTETYANWIAEALNCEAVQLKKVNLNELTNYDVVVYGGWIMAGMVSGYDKIKALNLKKLYVFGVGMSVPSDEVIVKMVEQNGLHKDNFFYFEGGYRPEKVGFFKRMMINMIKKNIEKKPEKSEEDLHMLETVKGADNTNKDAINMLVETIKSLR